MGLTIQYGKSKWWYGRVTVNGRYLNQNLGVEIRGQVPDTLRQQGDMAFELSRQKAQAALDKFVEEMNAKQTSQELLQRIHKLRTGRRAASLALDDMFASWKNLPRRKAPTARYLDQAESVVNRFIAFLKSENANVKEMADVQAEMAATFMRTEDARGVSPKTYNNTLILLRSAFETLAKQSGLAENPFAGLPTQEEETVHRKPFTAEELALVTAQAKADKFIGPVVLTGLSTAMRRGDCCLLKWSSVDLKDRFIAVKTAKTGETVRIPILPLLLETLEDAQKTKQQGAEYVFPEQAAMYQVNPDGITLRAKALLERAGFGDTGEAPGTSQPGATAQENAAAPSLGALTQKRSKGKRRVSVRDFHSLRVTWVTLALSAGVPMEIVQRVTGHRTAQIVLKHYFQPGKDDYRRTLEAKLPALMGGKPKTPALSREQLVKRLEAMTAENWPQIREELLLTAI
jgi:integrase